MRSFTCRISFRHLYTAILLTKRLDVSCVVCLNANNHAQKILHTLTTGGAMDPPPTSPLDPPLHVEIIVTRFYLSFYVLIYDGYDYSCRQTERELYLACFFIIVMYCYIRQGSCTIFSVCLSLSNIFGWPFQWNSPRWIVFWTRKILLTVYQILENEYELMCISMTRRWCFWLFSSTTLYRWIALVTGRCWWCRPPGHCPEILKIILKFTPCPEFLADVLKFLSTPGHATGTQAFISASGSGGPCPCEPQTQLWTLKTEGLGILVLWHCWRYGTNSALILLVSGNYCILDDFNDTFSACLSGFVMKNVLKF